MEKRIIYFDYLRLIATFAVVIIHVSGQNWSAVDVNSMDWSLFNFFNSIVRWGVPMFVLISGALFLDLDVSVKMIYRSLVPRMMITFFLWSALYIIFSRDEELPLITQFLTGHFHMWFVLMIAGLYMCIPVFQRIASDEKGLKYFLLLAFIFNFFVPWAVRIMQDLGPEFLVARAGEINSDITYMGIQVFLGYSFYYLAGYYLKKTELSARARGAIYALGILGFVLTIFLNQIVAWKMQAPCNRYYNDANVNVCLETIAIFVWFQYHPVKNEKLNALVVKLSGYTFGIYLVHPMIMENLSKRLEIHTLCLNPILSVPALGVLIFLLALAITFVLKHIPIFKKYC